MARQFDANVANKLTNANAVKTAAPITLAGWFNSNSLTAEQAIISIGDVDVNTQYMGLWCRGNLAGDYVAAISRAGSNTVGGNSASAYTTNTWHHGGGVWVSSTSRTGYLDGVAGTTDTNSMTPVNLDVTGVGVLERATPAVAFDGELAEVAAWDVALTTAEMEILAAGYSPLFVRPASLLAYWPLIGRDSPEIDRVGGLNLTVSGTVAAAAHPRIIYPSRPMIITAPAGAPAGTWPHGPLGHPLHGAFGGPI